MAEEFAQWRGRSCIWIWVRDECQLNECPPEQLYIARCSTIAQLVECAVLQLRSVIACPAYLFFWPTYLFVSSFRQYNHAYSCDQSKQFQREHIRARQAKG